MNKRLTRILAIRDRIARVARFRPYVRLLGKIEMEELQAIADHERNTIVLTTRLVDRLNDDELAWVVSHEIIHLASKHHVKRSADATRVSADISQYYDKLCHWLDNSGRGILVRIGGRLIGVVALGAIGQVAINTLTYPQEKEADVVALSLMIKAGYNPEAALSALGNLYGGRLPDLSILNVMIGSHPDPRIREHLIKKTIRQLQQGRDVFRESQ